MLCGSAVAVVVVSVAGIAVVALAVDAVVVVVTVVAIVAIVDVVAVVVLHSMMLVDSLAFSISLINFLTTLHAYVVKLEKSETYV